MQTKMQQDANKNTDKGIEHEPQTNYEEKTKLDRIEPITLQTSLTHTHTHTYMAPIN